MMKKIRKEMIPALNNKPKSAHDGFSLIEVLVAMTLIMVVLFAYTLLFTSSFDGIFRAGRKSEELFSAQGNIESLIAVGDGTEGQVIELEFSETETYEVWGRMPEVGSFTTFISESTAPIRFVAVGDEVILISQYGDTWIKAKVGEDDIYSYNFVSIVYGGIGLENKYYYALSDSGYIISSFDGLDWIIADDISSLSPANTFKDITWGVKWGNYEIGFDGDHRYLIVGDNGTIISSEEGSTWNLDHSTNNIYLLNGLCWGQSTENTGHYVAVGESGTILISAVVDGSYTGNFTHYYVDVGESGTTLIKADDLDTISEDVIVINETINDITWENGNFVIVGEYGTIVKFELIENNVEAVVKPFDYSLKSITYGNGYFVAVGGTGGGGGVIIISKDGINWTDKSFSIKQADGISESSPGILYDVTWSYNRFIAVGNDTILTSLDGLYWFEVESFPEGHILKGVTGR